MRKNKRFFSASSVIDKLFVGKEAHFSEIYFLFQLKRSWKFLAGSEIAKLASPVQFKNQVLTLKMPDATHVQEMRFVLDMLKEKINKKFKDSVKEIHLKHV